jgi:hypothetical protein
LYKCKVCRRQFLDIRRLDKTVLYSEYVFGKQTLKQLATKHQVSSKTIQRKLHQYTSQRLISRDKSVVVLMDATYWGWRFGVVVFKDFRTKKILWHKYIRKKEMLSDYLEGVDWLRKYGFTVEAIVCDGLRGMFTLFSCYPVQMCQFHQVSIVRRYLTKQPELEASKELWSIVKVMSHTDKESFIGEFLSWELKWSDFLKERSVEKKTGKKRYTHQRLRSAYLSLKRNMKYLWTFYDYPEIGIPNTNNSLEGTFADLKTKLRNHNGLAKIRRKVFIDEYFKGSFSP